MSKNRVSLTSDFLKAGDPSLCKCIRQVVICHYKLSDTLHKVFASQEHQIHPDDERYESGNIMSMLAIRNITLRNSGIKLTAWTSIRRKGMKIVDKHFR
jgi:hypothetical protein